MTGPNKIPTKRKWIFLRGLGRENIHWGDFPKLFSERFPNDEVLLLNTRGNGEERHLPSFLKVEDSVRDLRHRSREFRQKISGEDKVHLLCISLGAMLGLTWAELFPDEIAELVCINTSIGGLSPFYRRLRPKNYLPLLKLNSGVSSQNEFAAKVLELTTNTFKKDPNSLKNYLQSFAQRPPTPPLNSAIQLISALRFRPPKTKPKVPILILASEKDQFVHSQCSKDIAMKWQLPISLHPWAGHDLPLEDPSWICEQIQKLG